jgi:hypothetical protein
MSVIVSKLEASRVRGKNKASFDPGLRIAGVGRSWNDIVVAGHGDLKREARAAAADAVAFGLLTLKDEPMRSSTKSISDPDM